MVTVCFYLIRHGESTDNLKQVWAGWKDSPLSNHGMNQAQALAAHFSQNNLHFSHILSSDLARARDTGRALTVDINAGCALETNQLLREQCFGKAEGAAYTTRSTPGLTPEAHYAKGLYPLPRGSKAKFPGGESKDDLAARGQRAVSELLLPLIMTRAVIVKDVGEAEQKDERDVNVAVVSHGMMIKQLVRGLLLAAETPDNNQINGLGRQFLHNTGWARVVVTSQPDTGSLIVRLTEFDSRKHLEGLSRQKGGIGSLAHDKAQKDIRAFFGGQTTRNTTKAKREDIQPAEEIQREEGI